LTSKLHWVYNTKETGIGLSGTQVRRILKAKKYVYLWAKYSLEDKQNLEERSLFKQKLAKYLRIAKESPERLQVWFWDETGFSLRVIRRKNWCKKGTRRKKRGDRRKGRINVMGAVILEKIAAEMPNLVLEFLPKYSPDYNLAELVWHSAKEYTANRLFESIEKLELLLHQLLNEGELIIKWGRKIKNKGNAVNAI